VTDDSDELRRLRVPGLEEVRRMTSSDWIVRYDENRPHESARQHVAAAVPHGKMHLTLVWRIEGLR